MYPVSAVLIAVSTKDSLPAIVWKKNSGEDSPVKKLFLINPKASGSGISSFSGKWGKVLPENPFGTLLPPIICYPTHPIIYDKFVALPFDPHVAIINGPLDGANSYVH